ncbi:MAG: carboxypeptidase M32 [Myxococcales bacterium]|nr:carboxypeptidase M32 [Myxococcales bacterium]
MTHPSMQPLYDAYEPIASLLSILEVLHWDQEVMMPNGAASQRAEQLAALQATIQEKMNHPSLEEKLVLAESSEAELSHIEKADLRELRRSLERSKKLPPSLVKELAKQEVLAVHEWADARKKEDFSLFSPSLERFIDLKQQYADALRSEKMSRYDALLQDYEPGESEDSISALFGPLQQHVVELLQKIQAAPLKTSTKLLQGTFPAKEQERFLRSILPSFGFSFEEGRLDTSTHPFCAGSGADVRITTRYDEGEISDALFGVIHETGHALYEQGIQRDRIFSPAGTSASLGLHESQSRLWENMVGRSLPFWKHFYPKLQESFPSFQEIPLQGFWHAVNHVEPSFIRTQADEVTYNLHIIMRFDLERALIAGDLKVKDLPQAWNERFQQDFGLLPPNDRLGVLQDIHWASGLFGYFPTYALGNLYAAQWFERIEKELPQIHELIEKGELLPLREWLKSNIHCHGRVFLARDLCQRVTEKELSVQPFVRYLFDKYAQLYQFSS